MTRVKLNLDLLKFINVFEAVSQAKVKDCFQDPKGNLIFVVYPGEASKAIGKKGSNVSKVAALLKRKIKIVEFIPDVEKFIINLIYPIKVESIYLNGSKVFIKDKDLVKKAQIVGRNANNLRFLETVVKKYFPQVDEIRVV